MSLEPEKKLRQVLEVTDQVARGGTFVCFAMDGQKIETNLSDMRFQSESIVFWYPYLQGSRERPLVCQVSCSVSSDIPLKELDSDKEADMARYKLERDLKQSSLDFGEVQRTLPTEELVEVLRLLFPHQVKEMVVCVLAAYKVGNGTMTVFAHHPDITTPQALQMYQRATAE